MAKQRLNFGSMALAELAELREKVERALEKKVSAARADLQERMAALSAIVGADVVKPVKAAVRKVRGGARKAHPMKGHKVAPKYRGPAGELWTGRGRAPRWLAELEKKGKKRDQFLIAKG